METVPPPTATAPPKATSTPDGLTDEQSEEAPTKIPAKEMNGSSNKENVSFLCSRMIMLLIVVFHFLTLTIH